MNKEKLCEATEVNGKIYFKGWFKVVVLLVNILWITVAAISGYAYVVVLPTMTENIIQNDKESRTRDEAIRKVSYENARFIDRMDTKLNFIIDNQNEFKSILKRTAPYERKIN